MTIGHAEVTLAKLARASGGPFTHAQARRSGFSQDQIAQRVRAGLWVRLHPRVYAHASTLPTADVRRRAAIAWAGSNAYLSHRSAAEVWGFDGVVATQPEITVVGTRHPRSRTVTVHRTEDFGGGDRARKDGVPLTSPTRTVIDLASVLDETTLRIAFESARRQRLTTIRKVRRRLQAIGGAGRPGASVLNDLLHHLDGQPPSESPLEVHVARLLESAAIQPPVRQYEVRVGNRVFRLDHAWPPRRLALECEGRLRHSEDSDFQHDRERWSVLASIGWRILFVTWRDVTERPEATIDRVRTALAA